jgi:hypothetical protein
LPTNVAQNYAYSSETEAERSASVEKALTEFEGLRDKVATESGPLDQPWRELQYDDPSLQRWWVWVCPADGAVGRLHVAGYGAETHAVYTICDHCGKTFLR